MSYTPNFTDRRVIKRLRRALAWAHQHLDCEKPRPVGKRTLTQYLSQQQDNLGGWLRSKLLVTTKATWSLDRHECKEYCLNGPGYQEVCQLIKISPQKVSQVVARDIAQEFQQELKTGEFVYQEKNFRKYHPIQNLPKPTRSRVLGSQGYIYDYDIVCAAPSLLYNLARSLGFPDQKYIPDFIAQRAHYRAHYAQKFQVDEKLIKKTIIGWFQGAYLSKWRHSRSFREIDCNYFLVDQLRADPYLTELRQEIQAMWRHITQVHKQRGLCTLPRVTGKYKAQVYREQEDRIRNLIERYLTKHNIRYFLIHDGFQTPEVIDISDLSVFIKNSTGFQIDLEMNNLLELVNDDNEGRTEVRPLFDVDAAHSLAQHQTIDAPLLLHIKVSKCPT